MIDINHNLIKDCPLCEIFSHLDEYDLIYPEIDKIATGDYIIIRCKECTDDILILRDHTEVITNEMFGKMLYTVKKLYKSSIKMDTTSNHYRDHFHCHIKSK